MPRFGIRGSLSFLLALDVLLTGCSGGSTHDVCGIVLAVDGSLTIADRRAPVQRLDPGARFCAGAALRTAAGSSAQIACLASTRIQLSPETDFELERLTLRKDGNDTGDEIEARQIRCRLPGGLIYLSHQRAWGSSELVLVTPHGTLVASSDCLVRVRVDNHLIRITSARGACGFRPANGDPAVAVNAGFLYQWPSPEPTPEVAANDAAAQREIGELLAVEQRMASLSENLRSAPPPWARR